MASTTPLDDAAEIAKFDALSHRFWDPAGEFRPLHLLNPVRVEFGTAYADPGASAYDIVDGDVTSSIGVIAPPSIGLPGTYQFLFSASDHSGNTAHAIRVVNVVDDVAPVITIIGDNLIALTVGDTYTDAGATATDNVDGDITNKIVASSNVTTAVAGSYPITYSVTDSSGNRTSAVRTIVVNEKPDFFVTPQIQFISSFARLVSFDVYNRSNASAKWKAEHARGATILFSTHVMPHAEELCDHVVMINKGRKVLDASVSSIKFGVNRVGR